MGVFKAVKLLNSPVIISGNVTMSGGVALSLGGNTDGVMAVMSSGSVSLIGGNNITLSQDANTVTIIGGAGGAGGSFSAGVSTIGNTSGATKTVSNQIVFAGGNNITLSQATDAGGATVTVSGPSLAAYLTTAMQSGAGSQFIYTTAGLNLTNVSATLASNSLSLSVGNYITTARASNDAVGLVTAKTNVTWTVNSNGISLDAGGYAGIGTSATNASITLNSNGLAISVDPPGAGAGFTGGVSTLGNTLGDTGTVSNRIVFAGGNNITLSQSTAAAGATITISSPNTVAQTNQTVGLYGLGNTTQNSSTTLDARTLSFNGLGGMTVGYSNGSIQFSAPQTVAQSNQNLSLYALNQTTQNSSTVLNANAMSIAGHGIVTVGYSNGSIQISATEVAQTNQNMSLYALGNTTQNSSTLLNASNMSYNAIGSLTIGYSNGSIQFSAPNALTTAMASNRGTDFVQATAAFAGTNASGTIASNGISVSVAAPGAAAENNWVNLLGANTAGNTTASGSTIGLSGINMTLSGTNGSIINLSVPATSSLSATGGIQISTNASTISIGMGKILSNFHHPENMWTSLGVQGQGSLSIKHMYVPFNVSGSAMKMGVSMSGVTNTSATTASCNLSLWMGIYTLNGSSLSLASSGSANNGFQWSQSASSTANTSVNSMRALTVPMNVNMTPGEYWVAAVISSATTYTSAVMTFYGGNLINNAATANGFAPIGSGTTASSMAILFQGIYTAATSVGPASLSKAHVNWTSASNVVRANFYNQILNDTY